MRQRWAAVTDLLERYRQAWLLAWGERHVQAHAPPQPYEREFLPAALALQETPVAPGSRAVLWVLVALVLVALLWAVFAKVDIVAVAQGKVIASGQSKQIQSVGTAVIKAIHVHDGQQVGAGDVLLELDARIENADRARAASELDSALLQAARAQGLLRLIEGRGSCRLELPEGTSTRPAAASAWESRLEPAAVREGKHLLQGQCGEFEAKRAQLDHRVGEHEGELKALRESVARLQATVPIARQRAEDAHHLSDQGYLAKHSYLELESQRIDQEGQLAEQTAKISQLEATLAAVRDERSGFVAEARRSALESLKDADNQGALLRQDVIKANTRSVLMTLVAPVDGIVQQLAVHTVGGVVTPAQTLMWVVPQHETLEIESFLQNKDVGFVEARQRVAVKLESFPYTKYGTLEGRVSSVSADAIPDEKLGLVYSVRVHLLQDTIQVDGSPQRLTPGMAATVEIMTGRRRVIEYFLSPLLQHTRESLKER